MNNVPLLTQSEQYQLLEEWTNTQTDYPRESTIHQLFQLQAAQTPNSIAIAYKNQEISYHELDKKANKLANYLQNIGVTAETLVALYLDRSPDLIITILAILKAGGSYLPLDTSAPKNRIKTIIEDSKTPILITQKSELNQLQEIDQYLQIICLDDNLDLTNIPNNIIPDNKVSANNLAYVMYTSGSTGKPKGVCILHRGVIRLVKNTNYAHFGPDEVVLQLASIAFDAATFEIWGPLLNGGKLVLIPGKIPSLQEIGEVIKQYNITTLWLTAGLFNLIVEEHIETLKPLRQILAGGDILSITHVKKVLEELPNCQLINGYGPTENTTFTCCHKITIDDTKKESIPIGRPIANTQVYILDNDLQLVPIGITGELYIGGDGLAKGYLNQPYLTTEKFIKNPFSSDPNSYLYKTGDRVRWNTEGNIEFLGRIDFQVKIRGYRVELGEIDTILTKNTQIQSTVILTTEDNPNHKQIIAYIIPKTEITVTELRTYLQDKLPDYMIPSEFIFLKEFPLNINGKIDRQQLLNLRLELNKNNKKIISPRTPIETQLVIIWTEILGKSISINDEFTQLGGNSLQAIQIISRIRDILDIDLPIQELLKGSTIRELATIIETSKIQENSLNWSKLELKKIAGNGDFPLSLYQERMWLITQQVGKNPVYNLPIIFRLQGSLNIPMLEKAINQLIQRHESLRTFFPVVNGFPLQRILSTFSLNLPVELISEDATEKQIKQQIQTEINHPFQLSQKPPIRCLLLQLNLDNFIFIIVIHHLIADGWSLGIILQELSSIYNCFIDNNSTSLSPVVVQYQDFSINHQQWLQNPQVYRPLVDYWSQKLKDLPSLISLPTDHPRPPLQTFEGGIQSFDIDAELTQKLYNLSQQTKSTLYMILLGVFLIFLNRYIHQEDLVIGVPVANRNRTEIEGTIGCFSNVTPFRLNLAKNSSFLELLDAIKQVSLEAYTYQEFPVEQMLRNLGKSRDFGSTPWFQVVFNFLNIPINNLDFSGVKSSPLLQEKPSALFDLMVLSWPTSTGIEGFFEYNTKLFKVSTIQEFIKQFKIVLQEIINNPTQNIQNIPLLTQKNQNLFLTLKHKINYDAFTFLPNLISKKSHQITIKPQTRLELNLVNIWEQVLNVNEVNLQDNFFDLGGHSLLAMRILGKIEQEFNVNIPLSDFLQKPTIASLVQLIKYQNNIKQKSSIVTIQNKGENPPLFFINSISQAQKMGSLFAKDQPFYILNIFAISEFLKPQINSLKIEDIATKFIEDMQTIQPQGPYFLITYCGDSFLTFEMAQQLQAKGEKIALLAFIDGIWEPQNLEFSLFWYNFRQFGLDYLIERFKNRFFWTKERCIIRFKHWQGQLFSKQNKPLSPYLEDVRLLKAFELARNQYLPESYSGKVTLFVSQEYRLLKSTKLESLVTEGVEIQEIPGYHHTLFKDPYVQILVEKIQIYLNKNIN